MSFFSQEAPVSAQTRSMTSCATSHRWQPGLPMSVTVLSAGFLRALRLKREAMTVIVPPSGGPARP